VNWTRYADQAPEDHQTVIVLLHGETYPDGTTLQSEPVEYYPPVTAETGEGLGPRWSSWDDATNKRLWERIHPEDQWRPVEETA